MDVPAKLLESSSVFSWDSSVAAQYDKICIVYYVENFTRLPFCGVEDCSGGPASISSSKFVPTSTLADSLAYSAT